VVFHARLFQGQSSIHLRATILSWRRLLINGFAQDIGSLLVGNPLLMLLKSQRLMAAMSIAVK
jgi:hypothetical protein